MENHDKCKGEGLRNVLQNLASQEGEACSKVLAVHVSDINYLRTCYKFGFQVVTANRVASYNNIIMYIVLYPQILCMKGLVISVGVFHILAAILSHQHRGTNHTPFIARLNTT